MKKLRRTGLLAGASLLGLLLVPPSVGQIAAPVAASAETPAKITRSSQPWAQEKSDVPADRSIRYGTLPNGLRFAIRHNATPPGQASIWLRIDAGSLHENEDQLGLAHFMEHMAFNGTTEIPKNELIHRLERLGLQFGADLNAGTSYDQTFYRLDMPRIDDAKLDTALHTLRQQVSAATMDPKGIDDERGVIAGEKRLRFSPAVVVGLKQLDILGAGTRLPKRNPIGDMEIIRTAPRERFVEYYRTWYRPSRATVIAVGDFDVNAMETRIRKQFADWAPSAPDGAEPDLGTTAVRGQQAHVYVEPSLSPTVMTVRVSRPQLDLDTLASRRDRWARRLALAVLQRRFDELSRTDSPPFVNAQVSEDTVFRSLRASTVSATYLPGKWKEALAATEQGVRQLLDHGLTDAELTREVTSWRTRLENGVKNAATRNTVGLAAELNNDVNQREVTTSPETDLAIFEAAVKGLTSAGASAAARTIFASDAQIVSLNAQEPVEGGDAALAAAYSASTRVAVAPLKAPAAKAWAYTDFGLPGRVASISKPDALGAMTVTFENGVTLRFKHTEYSKNAVTVGLLTGIGEHNFAPDKLDPRMVGLGNFISGGLTRMTTDEMSRALNGHVVGAGMAILGQRFLIQGGTNPKDLHLQMQYMSAFLTDAAFRSAPFEKVIATAPAGWALANSSPEGVYGIKARSLLAGGDQRRAFAPPEVSRDWRMDSMRDDLKAMMAAGPLELVIVGDTTLDAAIKATAATFGALPKRPPYNPPAPGSQVRKFAAPTVEPLVFTHNGLAEQALGSVTWPTVDVTGPRRPARQLSVLKSVVQLRVLDVIREAEALAYSPGVSEEFSPDYSGYGTLTISAATAPEKLPAFYAAVDRIVRDLQDRPIDADELRRARQPMLEHLRQNMNTNDFWYTAILGSAYRPSSIEDALTVETDYLSVTPALIRQLAREYLRPDRVFKASVVRASEKVVG